MMFSSDTCLLVQERTKLPRTQKTDDFVVRGKSSADFCTSLGFLCNFCGRIDGSFFEGKVCL